MEQLTQLRSMIAKGVTSLEQNGEKVAFRNLDEMLAIERRMVAELGATPSVNGLHTPSFTRGRR